MAGSPEGEPLITGGVVRDQILILMMIAIAVGIAIGVIVVLLIFCGAATNISVVCGSPIGLSARLVLSVYRLMPVAGAKLG
jgi:ABC-type phosphate/phosphonate transport system permease subunit